MARSEEALKNYVQKILSIQKEKSNRPLSEAEMKQIALELGMSESDWKDVQKTVQEHITRGQGYLQYQNWNDALEEFKQAHAIAPNNLEVLEGLSQAHFQKWKQGKEKNDQNQAGYFARKYLQFVPSHQASLQLISELKKGESLHKPFNKRIAILSGVVGSLVVILLVVVVYLNQSNHELEKRDYAPPTQASSPDAENTSSVTKNSEGQSLVKVSKSASISGEDQLPVELVVESDEAPFAIELESSELSPYSDAFSYRFKGFIVPKGVEIDELVLQYELVDKNGKVAAEDTDDSISEHFPTVRSGDKHPIDFLIHKKRKAPNLEKVVISIQKIDQSPAPSTYDASPEAELLWQIRKPSNVEIIIRERYSKYSVNEYLNKGEVGHKLVLEIENTGQRRLEELTVAIEWLDQADKVLISKEAIITYSSQPKMLPGHTRIEYVLEDIPVPEVESIKGYRVQVIEAE